MPVSEADRSEALARVEAPSMGGSRSEARLPIVSDEPLDLLGLTSDRLRHEAEARVGRGAGVWRAVYRDLFERGQFEPASLGLSERAIQAWKDSFRLRLLEVSAEVQEASLHHEDERETRKVSLRTHDGLEVEAVRIPMSKGRTTLCLSSQVGCRIGCRFCETGRLGLLRNLSSAEMVAQIVTARFVLGWPVDNLVFMGMGEPLDNAENLVQALRVMCDPRGLAFGQQRITVCTSGVPSGLETLGKLGFRRMGLSFSLNAAVNEKRNRLMPINRKHPLEEVREALIRYPKREGFVMALNYCLLPGFNDEAGDAVAVARFAAPLGRVLVNVIPYNPGTKPLTRAPTEDEVATFIARLKDEGLPVRERRTKGRSVMAACGQLGNLELRAIRRSRGLLGERSTEP